MEGTRPQTGSKASRPGLELVVGPAGSGKTAWCVSRVIELLKASRRVMVILPTPRAVTDFKLRLLAGSAFDVIWRPEILTFTELGYEVLRSARPGLRCISRVAQEIILAEVVADLNGQGSLPLLSRLAPCVGLVGALRAWIAEFKRAEITPEAFAEFCKSTPGPNKDAELALIYVEYQRRLHELNLYDPEGQFWHAKEILECGPVEPAEGLDSILLDGFYDFTPMELSVLQLLGGHGCKLAMTIVHDPGGSRPDLFERPGRTLERLHGNFSVRVKRLQPLDDRPVQLRHLERNLFAREANPCPKEASGAVSFLETPGDLVEFEEMARTIKGELVPAGIPLEDVCIIARSPSQYASIASDVFGRFGIPYHLEDEIALSEAPVGKLALQILAAVNEDFPLSLVATLFRSGLLDLTPIAPEASRIAHSLQDVCMEAGIVRGRGGYAVRLRALAKRLQDRLEMAVESDENDSRYIQPAEIEARLRLVEEAGSLLDEIFKRFEPLLAAKTFGESAEALVQVMEALGIRRALCPSELRPQDLLNLRSYEALRSTLEDLVLTVELVGWEKCGPAEFALELERMMGEKVLSSPLPRQVGVTLMGVHEARTVSFPVVFVCGMLDRMFPRAHREGPFHDDTERARMEKAGLNLRPRRAEQSEESLLFYLACTRARKRLYLTHPVTDREGKERLVSHYIDEVANALGKESLAGSVRRLRLNDLIPSTDRISSLTELRRRTIKDVCTHGTVDMHTLGPMLDYVRNADPWTFELMRSGLAAEADRESFQPFGSFDGVLHKPLITSALREHYGREYPFSPSALEDYATCPFRFFCRHVLGLVEPATLEEELTPADFGILYHEILWEFFHTLRAESPKATALVEDRREDYLGLMKRIAQTRLRRFHTGREDVHPVLWTLAAEEILRTLGGFVDVQTHLLGPESGRRPAYLEVSFGLRRRRGVSDELSTGDRLVLETRDEDPVSVAGKIDRIDVVEDDQGGFIVVDYKSGRKLAGKNDILRGTFLQLPLYVLAAEGVLLAGRDLPALAGELYGLQTQRTSRLMKRTSEKEKEGGGAASDEWTGQIDAVKSFVRQYVGGVRRGEFPVFMQEPRACPVHCEFRQVCRYSERRALKKSQTWKPWFHHVDGKG